jgi:isocitrate dehydrogenase
MEEKIVIPYIEGDGSGEDIWRSSKNPLEEAVWVASGGNIKIEWIPLLAGQKALDKYGVAIPAETLNEVKNRRVAIKGPLTTPVGGGFRSVNVLLRQVFDLYVCMRPIRHFDGLPSPLKRPEAIDLIIFRENTEDVYRGIEWAEGSTDARRVLAFLKDEMNVDLPTDTAIGIKPMSRSGTRRFARWVFNYAVTWQRKAITIVHKGNIMKFTEGAFMKWAYEVMEESSKEMGTVSGERDISVNDRIADTCSCRLS